MNHIRIEIIIAAVCLCGCDNSRPSAVQDEKSKQADTQMTNVANSENDIQWTRVSSADGSVSVELPGTPIEESQDVDSKLGKISVLSQKTQHQGVFWKIITTTLPQAAIDGWSDGHAFLEKNAEGNELQKPQPKRIYLRRVEQAAHPTIEHKFEYAASENQQGQTIGAGVTVYRTLLIGTNKVDIFFVHDASVSPAPTVMERFWNSVTTN